MVNEGYKYWFNDTLITVWSAPNYCYRCANKTSIMKVSETLEKTFDIFDAHEKSANPVAPKDIFVPYFL